MEAYSNRAFALLEMGKYENAIRDYSVLIEHNNRNDDYYLKRGTCHVKLKQYTESLADYSQCITLNPGNR